MPKEEENLDLSIDTDTLDEEWKEQPVLYGKHAEKVANARLNLDEAKSNLEVVKAELDKTIRESPEDYDIPKVTEAAVQATILLQEEYKESLKAVHMAQYTLNLHSGYLNALDHRKKALEKLVDLFLADYFSAPRQSKGRKEATSKAAPYKRRNRDNDD